MDEIEAFVEECRADPWFQSHPLAKVLRNAEIERL
jgi:hypothetical protein